MSRIHKLRERKAELVQEGRQVLDTANDNNGALSAENEEKYGKITAELATVNAAISREVEQLEVERGMDAVHDDNEPAPPANENRFESLGDQLIAAATATSWGSGHVDPRLRFGAAPTGAGETTGSDGGYLVQQDFSAELLRRAYELGVFASRVRRVPVSANANGLKVNAVEESSRKNGSRWGGIQAQWTGEAAELGASRPKFRQMDLQLRKLTGLMYSTEELLQDAAALEAIAQDAFSEEFAFKLDDAIYNGNGDGMPFGFMRSPALVSVPKESGQGANTVVFENVANMWARMWTRSRMNSVWFINQEIEPQLMTMKIGDTPIFLPGSEAAGRPFNTLLGRPLIATEFNEAKGDKGDIVLADMSQYLLIDKGTIKSDTSIHVRFIHDELAFRFIIRADGQPIWNLPVTPFKGTDTQSPFVTLDERG